METILLPVVLQEFCLKLSLCFTITKIFCIFFFYFFYIHYFFQRSTYKCLFCLEYIPLFDILWGSSLLFLQTARQFLSMILLNGLFLPHQFLMPPLSYIRISIYVWLWFWPLLQLVSLSMTMPVPCCLYRLPYYVTGKILPLCTSLSNLT